MAWDLGRKHDSPIFDGAEGGAGGSMSDLLRTNIHSHLDNLSFAAVASAWIGPIGQTGQWSAAKRAKR
jgi:hypothetical protein